VTDDHPESFIGPTVKARRQAVPQGREAALTGTRDQGSAVAVPPPS